jgi:glycosyltransferase involved in cell wall biosynthesis
VVGTVSILYVEPRSINSLSLSRILKDNYFQVTDTRINNVNVFRMHAWNPLMQFGTLGGRIWSYITLKLFEKYIKKYGKPDIIHAHNGLWAGYASAKIKQKFGIPFIITEHSAGVLTSTLSEQQEVFLKKSYFQTDEIVAVGRILSLKVGVLSNKKVEILSNLVDASFFEHEEEDCRYNKNTNVFTLVSIGNLVYHKGFDTLIKAFSEAFKNQSNVKLNIIGDGVLHEDLKQLILDLQVEDQVKLLGRFNQTEIKQEFEKSDVFVLASHFETFGVVFIEAMSMGLPVIGTQCGGPEDFIIDDVGILLEPKNVHALATAMKHMRTNIDKYDSVKIRNYILQKYDTSIIVEKIIAVYHSVLSDAKKTIK